MSEQKIFGIGFHKTGTTSLALALKILGYNCNRGLDVLKEKWGLEKCVQYLKDENYEPYLEYIKDFDASLDNPWYLLYEELDNAFPNSKFIMTLRHEDKWLESCRHFFEGTNNLYRTWLYGTSEVENNEEAHLNRYRIHIDQVKKYFMARPNDLLIVNWEENFGWNQLCEFLEKPVINLPFPHLNRKGDTLYQ